MVAFFCYIDNQFTRTEKIESGNKGKGFDFLAGFLYGPDGESCNMRRRTNRIWNGQHIRRYTIQLQLVFSLLFLSFRFVIQF